VALPCHGIGLARMEFIINNAIKIHPMALVKFDRARGQGGRKAEIEELTARLRGQDRVLRRPPGPGHRQDRRLAVPEPVIVRMSDFKTNEYADLIGGAQFEPKEENPMLGFRGASRYYSDRYREGFALECRAIKRCARRWA
jgi:pyruvate, water dikinase